MGVLIYNDQYTAITDNVMTDVRVGIQTGNFHDPNPGTSASQAISGNQIAARRLGIFHNLFTGNSDPITVSNNTITAVDEAQESAWIGILLSSLDDHSVVESNDIDGSGTSLLSSGYQVWNVSTDAAVTIDGGTVDGVDRGIWVNNFEGYNSDAGYGAHVTIDGVSITASEYGVYVLDSPSSTNGSAVSAIVTNTTVVSTGGAGVGVMVDGADASAEVLNNYSSISNNAVGISVSDGAVSLSDNVLTGNTTGVSATGTGTLTLGSGNFILAGTTGLLLDGPDVGVSGLTLGDVVMDIQSADYITLANGALDNQLLDATGTTLGGVAVATATNTQLAAMGEKITDELDDGTLGRVVLTAGTILVSPTASPTATDNDYTRLKNAVEAAGPGDTIVLVKNGSDSTFNWDEPNALASWALGNDGTAATDDDYGILLPAGLNNVTVTADLADGITIQGSGDVASFDLEGVFLAFGNTTNTDWTFENFGILDFDNAIGFYYSGDDFSGLTVQNMHIRVADDDAADSFHNIGIHYGRGTDITIADNLIELTGGGGGATIGIQSNTHGGANYEGLSITGNTITVLNAGDETIYGIWENGSAHQSNIDVSGNAFTGNPGGSGQQAAFRLTSHSSATTAVTYNNNTVDQADIAFKWLDSYYGTPKDYSGTLPIQLSGNIVTNSGTAYDVGGIGASATISGGSVTCASGIGVEIADVASATVSGLTLQNLDVGVLVGGEATITGNTFGGTTDNLVDVRVASTATAVTIGNGNTFTGDTYFIENLSGLDIDLVGNTSTFDETNGFRIEDKLYHALDDAATGLIRVSAIELFVTTPGTGASDETIQNAIDAATSGDTVYVEAGTFAEQLEIVAKALTILGAGQGSTIIEMPASLGDSFTYSGSTKQAIVLIEDDADVSLSGLTVDGLGSGNAVTPGNDFVGIGVYNADATISQVTVTGITDTPFSGNQRGRAVFIGNDAGAHLVTVENATIDNYQKNAIDARGTGLTVDVLNSSLTGAGGTTTIAQNGIVFLGGVAGTIQGNTITGHDYTPARTESTGILLFDNGAATVGILGNTINANEVGIYAWGTANITGNDFDDAVDNAVDLWIDATATVAIGAGNEFAGDTYYIQNESATDYDLAGTPTTFDEADNFLIEDRLYHAPDNAASGLIRVVSGELFVTTPGTGASDETIQNAIDAADAGDTVNVQAGTYTENLLIDKAIDLIGAAGATTLTPATGGNLVELTGTSFGADDTVTITNFNFDGAAGTATAGVYVGDTVDLVGLEIYNGSFTGFNYYGVGIFGNAVNGDSVDSVTLDNLIFTNNGLGGGGGTGDVEFFTYNNDATLSNLTLVGSATATTGARLGIQFRGVGAGDGVSEAPMGSVSLDNIDISGDYRTQMIGIQRYSDVAGLSLQDVELGGAGSEITGSFGAALRFDAVGSGSLGSPATVDLGNTYFRGVTGPGGTSPGLDIEIAPDNTFTFLAADATGTNWDTATGTNVAAASLTNAELFEVEDRILHYVDGEHPTHGLFKGFVEVVDGNAYVSSTYLGSVQRGIDVVPSGGTVHVGTGTFTEGSQIVIDKEVDVVGQGQGITVLTPGFDTGSSGDARGWWLVESTGDLDVSQMTFDGTGNLVYQAFRHTGVGTFDDVEFTEIKYPSYAGVAIAAFGTGSDVDVTNSVFSEIGRVGVLYFGDTVTGTFQGNTYTGKGAGDWLDYALDISAGAVIDVIGNTISGNEGVASSDGSTSAGVMVTTYYGAGTTANLSGNIISGNTTGVFVGYDNTDTSVVTISGDEITGNTSSGVDIIGGDATIQNDTVLTGNGTGVLVGDGGTATIINNDDSITGNTIGIDVDGGTALIENNDLNGNTIGVLVQNGGVADLGDTSGANITGLGTGSGLNGSSAGLNDFSGYTAAATVTSGAVVVLNNDGGLVGPQGIGSGDLPAFGNTWNDASAAGIENVVWHDADDNNVAFVDFAGLTNLLLSFDQDPVDEGETADALTLGGTFSNDPQAHTVTIQWGDGSTDSVLNLAQGVFSFSADHTYADNGAYTVSVTVEEDATSTQISDSATANVANVPPTLTVLGNQTVNENSLLSLVDLGTITDPGFDFGTGTETFTYFIDWGDATTADTGPATIDSAGSIGVDTEASFDGSHTYADDGVYTVTVRVADDDMSANFTTGTAGVDFVEQSLQVTVDNVIPTLAVLGNQTTDEGTLLSLLDLGTITDPGFGTETFTYFIDWGDATSADTGPATIDSAGSIGADTQASFDGSHTYADDGAYTVTVRVADDDMTGNFTTGTAGVDFVEQTLQITVDNVLPTLAVLGNQTADEGTLLSLIDLGTITDPGFGTETFDYYILWGDSTAADTGGATIDVPGSVGVDTEASFDGTHTYADDGVYTVTVRVADDDMPANFTTGTAGVDFVEQTLQVTVGNLAPTIAVSAVPSSTDEGSLFTLDLGAVTDPGDDTVSGCIIEWGDGGSTVLTSNPENTSHTHTYDDGTQAEAVRITLLDEDGVHAEAGVPNPFTVTVNNVDPTATFFNTGSVNEGTSGTVGFTAQLDPSSADTTAGFHYAYDFDNDGTFDLGDGTFAGSGAASAASVPASYLADGQPGASRTVRGRIIDKDNGYSDFTTTIGIDNVVPTFDAGSDASVAVNTLFTRSLMFTDPGSETISPAGWIITVNYGDGSGDQAPASFNPATKVFGLAHTYTGTGTFTVTVQIDDQDGVVATDTFDVDVFLPTFQVASFTQFASGFDVQFNRAADLLPVNLYDGNDAAVDLPDVIVTTGGNTVDGSITWDAATNTLTFVKTGGVLADGTYSVTLRSGSDAFQDTMANALDGDANGTAGDDYSTSFLVSSSGERIVSLPDFARGAGQDVNVPAAAAGGLDLPISIDDASGVTAVDVDVVYDPNLLNITGASLGAGPTGAGGWSITTNPVSPGLLKITISGTTALSGSNVELIRLDADVPSSAPYADNEVIRLENLAVNESAIAAKADYAVHKAAYLADSDGDGQYLGNDAALISRVVVDLDTGFDAHDWTDPVIVADSTGNGALSGQDASNVAQEAALIDVPEIPPLPVIGPLAAGTAGIDPELSTPTVFGAPGDTVTVPVNIEVLSGEAADPTVLSATFDVLFNNLMASLTPADIAQGSFWNSGDGWSLTKNVLGGQARLVFFNSAPSAGGHRRHRPAQLHTRQRPHPRRRHQPRRGTRRSQRGRADVDQRRREHRRHLHRRFRARRRRRPRRPTRLASGRRHRDRGNRPRR